MEIIPSILVKTKQEFEEKIKEAEPYVDRAHVDIADGIFVPNVTIDGVVEVNNVDSDLNVETHLMVQKPENHIGRWMDTRADKIVIHVEATSKLEQIINELKEAEMKIGVALNPNTPIDKIKNFVDEIDFIHFLTVQPGFYGSEFVPEVVEKIKDFHYFYPDVPVEVDGSVNPETIGKLAEAGASVFVVGSYFWNAGNKQEALEELRNAIK